jgi:hypothetical protein
MAETKQNQLPAGEGPAVAEQPKPRPCPQDCNRCGISQQIFCCTRMLFDLSRAQMEARQQIAAVEKSIADIQMQLQPRENDTQLSIPFIENG